jgi:hypothetical protein
VDENPQRIVQAWKLPEGKTYPDYFDTRVPEKKANTTDWPKLPHHKNPSKLKGLCLKYQSKGSCSAICYMAHADPDKMDSKIRKTIDDRFRQVYAWPEPARRLTQDVLSPGGQSGEREGTEPEQPHNA